MSGFGDDPLGDGGEGFPAEEAADRFCALDLNAGETASVLLLKLKEFHFGF